MEFLVFSDSHGDFLSMSKVIRKNPAISNVLYLGDGLADLAVIARMFPTLTVHAVRGNCDSLITAYDTPDIQRIEIYGTGILLSHGHTLGVKGGMGGAIARALRENAKVLLFGHTHNPTEEYVSEYGITLANPGSIGHPPNGIPSFGILTVLPNGDVSFSIGALTE